MAGQLRSGGDAADAMTLYATTIQDVGTTAAVGHAGEERQ